MTHLSVKHSLPPCSFMYVDEDPNVINMPPNDHDNSRNDALATIDPDVHIRRFTNCQYFEIAKFNSKFKNEYSLSMLHTNIRSSSRNICHFKSYLQTLNVNFSIIDISENWGTVENIDVQTMPGYSHEYCIRSNRKRGGGVSIYVKSNLPYKVRKSLAFTGNSYESIVIEFDKHVFNSKRNVIIGIFYRSPNSSLKLFHEKMGENSKYYCKGKKICLHYGRL